MYICLHIYLAVKSKTHNNENLVTAPNHNASSFIVTVSRTANFVVLVTVRAVTIIWITKKIVKKQFVNVSKEIHMLFIRKLEKVEPVILKDAIQKVVIVDAAVALKITVNATKLRFYVLRCANVSDAKISKKVLKGKR